MLIKKTLTVWMLLVSSFAFGQELELVDPIEPVQEQRTLVRENQQDRILREITQLLGEIQGLGVLQGSSDTEFDDSAATTLEKVSSFNEQDRVLLEINQVVGSLKEQFYVAEEERIQRNAAQSQGVRDFLKRSWEPQNSMRGMEVLASENLQMFPENSLVDPSGVSTGFNSGAGSIQ